MTPPTNSQGGYCEKYRANCGCDWCVIHEKSLQYAGMMLDAHMENFRRTFVAEFRRAFKILPSNVRNPIVAFFKLVNR